MDLYSLTKEYKRLLELAEEGFLEEEELEEAMADFDDEVETVAESMAKVMRQLEANNTSIDTEIERLKEMKARNTANAETVKRAIQKFLIISKKEKIKTELFSFNIQNNPPKFVLDVPVPEGYQPGDKETEMIISDYSEKTGIPKEYLNLKAEIKVDTTKTKAFLKKEEGQKSKWGHLIQERSLRIK